MKELELLMAMLIERFNAMEIIYGIDGRTDAEAAQMMEVDQLMQIVGAKLVQLGSTKYQEAELEVEIKAVVNE